MRELSDDRWLLFMDRAKSLRAYIRRRLDDPAEAEEVFQDLSLIVLRHRSGPKDMERFNAWCHSLARHVLAHHFRAKRRRANLLTRVELESAGFETSHRVDPERAASARELLRLLGKKFDPKARELLSQRYLLGESTEEIALRLEQSPTAIRMRLMRLRSIAKRKSS
ncbi:MAG TPA: sigma-70 family RNA polymerase sigma factor [Polyangiaceae bacterium]|jgi:RNA polymerase sigma-70 factor (ECF subfamily)|nr:sigma-70 family RNA polymerase sigma factor [Polyangiaceae bacterium]